METNSENVDPHLKVNYTCSDRSFDRLVWILDLSISYNLAQSTFIALALFYSEIQNKSIKWVGRRWEHKKNQGGMWISWYYPKGKQNTNFDFSDN